MLMEGGNDLCGKELRFGIGTNGTQVNCQPCVVLCSLSPLRMSYKLCLFLLDVEFKIQHTLLRENNSRIPNNSSSSFYTVPGTCAGMFQLYAPLH